MLRYDLAFFLCCCKSFLGSQAKENGEPDFYEMLMIDNDVSQDEIKRAYKRQSLMMHPDKLAQKGQAVTDDDQARFQRMKDAYEVLSDPHKRETYDAIGERGLKWLEEPFSLDPQEMVHNFAQSSILDRAKIFSIFLGVAVAIFLLPFLLCMHVDGNIGSSLWIEVLFPLWIIDGFVIFYFVRVIQMGPLSQPEGVGGDEWVDPLPMSKRYFSLFRFSLLCTFHVLVALKLDGFLSSKWFILFWPLYIWESSTLYKKIPIARMRIVTVDDLEAALGKPFSGFTSAEKDLIARRYSVVPSVDSLEFETAHKLKVRARQDIVKVLFRVVFMIFLIIQMDGVINWNWWFIFAPFWVLSIFICLGSCQSFNDAQTNLAEKDPGFIAKMTGHDPADNSNGTTIYSQMGQSTSGANSKTTVTEDEKEEAKTQYMQAGYKMVTAFCSQVFLLIILGLFVGKMQGAGYASLWIISPLLCMVGAVLTCLGCALFCFSAEDGIEYESGISGLRQQYSPPKVSNPFKSRPSEKPRATATWDPEKGQIWDDPDQEIELKPGVISQDPSKPSVRTHSSTSSSTQGTGFNSESQSSNEVNNAQTPVPPGPSDDDDDHDLD